MIEAERERAQLDRHHQHVRARARLRELGRERETRDTAGAAEPEDRNAPRRRAEAQLGQQTRLQARRRDPGRRHGDDRVDLLRAQPRSAQRPRDDRPIQVARPRQIGLRTIGPTVRLGEPLERTDGIAARDPVRGEHPGEPLVAGHAAAEERERPLTGDHLLDGVRRDGGCHREQPRRRAHPSVRRSHRRLYAIPHRQPGSEVFRKPEAQDGGRPLRRCAASESLQ